MAIHGITCHDLTFSRPGPDGHPQKIIDTVTQGFPAGTATLVRGENGAGKSTLVHLLACLLKPESGEVAAGGEPVSRWPAFHLDRWRRQVGIVFQQPVFLPELTVMENVIIPLIPKFRSWHGVISAGEACLTRTGTHHLAEKPVTALSAGERQRVTLARALVSDPDYLFMDEPTAHQDDTHTRRIIEIITETAAQGKVVVVTAHDSRITDSNVFDQTFCMENGRLKAVS